MAAVIRKMLDYAARPLSEFNKFEAIDILETLQNTSRDKQDEKREFYRLVYQTARGKVDLPKEHFRALILRLLGDKDHTKVYEAVAKVEKAMGTGGPWSGSSHRGRSSDVPYRGRGMGSSASPMLFLWKVRPHYGKVLREKRYAAKAPGDPWSR